MIDRADMERKYNLDPSRLLHEQSGAVDQVMAALNRAEQLTPAAAYHGQIRSAVGRAMSVPATVHRSAQHNSDLGVLRTPDGAVEYSGATAGHVWRVNTDAYGAPLNEYARDLRHEALAASESGVFGVHRLRLADHDLGAEAREWALPWPGTAREVARAVLARTPVTCWWCYWLRWDMVPIGGGNPGQEMAPRNVDGAMIVTCGATELLLGTCPECAEKFAADVHYGPSAIDYVYSGHGVTPPPPWNADRTANPAINDVERMMEPLDEDDEDEDEL